MTAAVQARAAAERLLGTKRVQTAYVWDGRRRDWFGPVVVEEELDGGREGYAYCPGTGRWYAPALWSACNAA
jgi:hypothetical protein